MGLQRTQEQPFESVLWYAIFLYYTYLPLITLQVTLWSDHGLQYSTAQTPLLPIHAPRTDQNYANAKKVINQNPKIVQNSLHFE